MVTALGVGHEGFRAAGSPLDRAAQLLGREENDDFLGVLEDLAAKTSAHVGRDHAQLLLRNAQHEGRQQQAVDVRVLRGGVQGVLVAGRTVLRQAGARLDGVGDQAVVAKLEAHHPVGLCEAFLHGGGVSDLPLEGHVAGSLVVNERGPLGHRLTAQRGRTQRRKVHVDQGGGVFGNGAGVGDHHSHDVAHVVHLGMGNRGVVWHHQSGQQPAGGNAAHPGHIFAGQDGAHAGQRQGRRGVDGPDLGVGVGAAEHGGVKLAMHVDVVGVAACAGNKPGVLHALDRLAHELLGAGGRGVVGIWKLGHGVLLWSGRVACSLWELQGQNL